MKQAIVMVLPDDTILPPNHVGIANIYLHQYRYHFCNKKLFILVKYLCNAIFPKS